MNLILFLVAWLLIPPLTVWNLIIVNRKYGNTKGYFRSTALSIDIWANREFRTLWNDKLKIDGGYEFGRENETISIALGKNERDKTLSKTGKILVWILNKIDKNHCQNSIDENFQRILVPVVDEETNEPILNEDGTPKMTTLEVPTHAYLVWLIANHKAGLFDLLKGYLVGKLKDEEFVNKLNKLT